MLNKCYEFIAEFNADIKQAWNLIINKSYAVIGIYDFHQNCCFIIITIGNI